MTKDGEIFYSLPKVEEKKAVKGLSLKEQLVGGKVDKIRGEGKAPTRVSYFRGKDQSKWKSDIPTYDLVSLGEVYKGIELKLRAYGNNVEKLFFVRPEGDPLSIRVKTEGAKNIKVNKEGELELETDLGVVKFTMPVAYQKENGKKKFIEVAYAVKGNEYTFTVGDYDRTKELVIDPLLASTFLGGSGNDWVNSISIDSSGNVYVAGETYSSDFPITTGAYDNTFSGCVYDAFVSKLNSNLTQLLASTFLSGSCWSWASCISVDSSGNVYVAGGTIAADDFPITSGAYQETMHGAGDAFVSKLNSDLTQLLASTFLGGSESDGASSISIDSSGNDYVAGGTGSSDFPVTTGTAHGGSEDAFVAKLNSDLAQLLASTFLGGYSGDRAGSISTDSSGNVYVAGKTYSSDFPTTDGAYDTTHNGGDDVFVSALDGNLQNLLASTFLGGSGGEGYSHYVFYPYVGSPMTIDSSGHVYVAGWTSSSDFPTTDGAHDITFDGDKDGFVSKLVFELNTPPVANAGDNLGIASQDQNITVIQGTATDPDNDPLTYRWLEGEEELSTWSDVGENGEACLDLSLVQGFSIGDHYLTLEVNDGQATSTDKMILTVNNSAPHPAPTGGGTYQIGDPVTLGGQVSDFDGDPVSYDWLEGENLLFSGQVQTNYGGDPVYLPEHTMPYLSLGTHTITLRVNDGINEPVASDILIEVIDTIAPTLAPVPDKTILWPPNHNMVDIKILANASDNSGGSVSLSAAVSSNEPEDGLGDGDMAPDWTEPVINQDTGEITLQLRAERSGSGDGRVYTITITATDDSGNSSTAAVKIIVPHDKRKK